MKTTLAALALSVCMLGISTAASNDKAKDPARQQAGKHHAKQADRKKVKHQKKSGDPEAHEKAADERAAKALPTQLKTLDERKARAEANRANAAKALKAAEDRIASIDAEKKKLARIHAQFFHGRIIISVPPAWRRHASTLPA